MREEVDAMKTLAFAAALAIVTPVLVGACTGNNNSSPADATVDAVIDQSLPMETSPLAEAGTEAGGREAGPVPTPPSLGTQIDRLGRPAINTALNNEFNPNIAQAGQAKDAYNFDSNPAHWSTYIPTFEQSLAILDGLDGVCGNQLAFGALGAPGYTTLATVLAADTLWINTASATCSLYLAVEFNALGVKNTDCGGRTLTYNVIDDTLNAVAGTLSTTNPPGPLTNGVTTPASPPLSMFPFLAAPH
jgi:hypothetical protein